MSKEKNLSKVKFWKKIIEKERQNLFPNKKTKIKKISQEPKQIFFLKKKKRKMNNKILINKHLKTFQSNN